MKRIVEAKDRKEFIQINNLLHDCLFEKDHIDYNEKERTLRITFNCEQNVGLLRKLRIFLRKDLSPSFSYLLQINNVDHYKIIGNSQNGPGDTELYNEILMDSNNNVKIRTFFAEYVEIAISSVDITLHKIET